MQAGGPTLTYVYCLLRGTRPRLPRTLCGVPGSGAVRLVPIDAPAAGRAGTRKRPAAASALWLVLGDVPRTTYGAAALAAGLRDLDWVSRCALAHETVVARLGLGSPATAVVPMKLFTLFHDDARAVARLQRDLERLTGILDTVEGCREWGLRATLAASAPRAARERTRAAVPRGAARPSGTSFLLEKQKARAELEERTLSAHATALASHDELAAIAKQALLRASAGQAAGAPGLLLDGVYLVRRADEARFRASAGELARKLHDVGAALTLTGPWPPYHFASAGGAGRKARGPRAGAARA